MVIERVAARYRDCGQFARHYVSRKLRHDPMSAILLRPPADGFGDVVDVGCGRGQFAALLLQAGTARRVIGLERSAALLGQARRALAGLSFEGLSHDLVIDPSVPAADTVLLVDVLYQLPTETQRRLLDAAANSARKLVLIRTADPARGLRARVTRLLELSMRRIWPNSGSLVNAQPIGWVADRLRAAGLTIGIAPCWSGTPFSNVLITARRGDAGPLGQAASSRSAPEKC